MRMAVSARFDYAEYLRHFGLDLFLIFLSFPLNFRFILFASLASGFATALRAPSFSRRSRLSSSLAAKAF
jgi:hypothetical protein